MGSECIFSGYGGYSYHRLIYRPEPERKVSLKLIGLFSGNNLGIGLTSVSIWFINLIIPALAGSLLILGIKRIFKNNNDEKT